MNRRQDFGLLVARVALAALYWWSATSKWGDLAGTTAALTAKGMPMPSVLAVLAACGELAGAFGITVGLLTRIAAGGLVVYTLLTALAFHDFWDAAEAARQGQLTHFLKNIGLAGGFLALLCVGPGGFSLDAALRRSRQGVPYRHQEARAS